MRLKESNRVKRIKKHTRKAYKKLLNELGINSKDLPLRFNSNKSIACYIPKSGIEGAFININVYQLLNILELGARKEKLFYFCELWTLNSVKSRLYFALGHELGHYIHYKKYNKTFKKWHSETIILRAFVNDKEYRYLKLERKADLIGKALLNRVLNKGLK